jgi:hypothetical protein
MKVFLIKKHKKLNLWFEPPADSREDAHDLLDGKFTPTFVRSVISFRYTEKFRKLFQYFMIKFSSSFPSRAERKRLNKHEKREKGKDEKTFLLESCRER